MPTLCVCLGLYYKLHGVHRPVTMKKSVIKRRKRIVPATWAGGAGPSSVDAGESSDAMDTDGGPERDHQGGATADSPPEEHQVNPDGSVSLARRQRRPDQPLMALQPNPESSRQQRPGNRQSSPIPTSDLAAYHSGGSYGHYRHHTPTHELLHDSLNNENRLAPLTSISMSTDRQSSLSPASFLSPSRKRSLSATETEFSTTSETATLAHDSSSKRLSSISSILNPAGESAPGEFRQLPPLRGRTAAPPEDSGSRADTSDSRSNTANQAAEKSKAERREILLREAERVRELLAQKERELAELGMD